MTLLLGPPGSGKSTLLLALAGKLNKSLRVKANASYNHHRTLYQAPSIVQQVAGKITYCGHELKESVPQRTSAYISQKDIHLGEMTVKETLDFSGLCLGVGSGSQTLMEVSRKEMEAGIEPDPEIDAFAKTIMLGERDRTQLTTYILKVFPFFCLILKK